MSVAAQTVTIPSEGRTESVQSCSLCKATGNYACIDHCDSVLCARCTSRHHFAVIQEMRQLFERLKTYRLHSISFSDVSDSKLVPASSDLQHRTDTSRVVLTNSNAVETYLQMLDGYLKKDRLINVKILADLHTRLSDRSVLGTRNTAHRSPIRSQSTKPTFSKSITVSLGARKRLALPIQTSFSMGQHPVVVSLVDHYLKTFFCQWRENSVILLSSMSIDVYSRSSGLKWSIPLRRVLGNIKDRIVAATWSPYIQRLILVGRFHFYVFDIDDQKVRSVCECGCGGRCGNGPMSPRPRRSTTVMYRSPLQHDTRADSQRFLACSYNEYLFYGKFQR